MKRMLWASSFALSLLVVGGASAQDKKEPDAAATANAAEANQRFREGLDLFRAGNTEGAYLKFKQAYAVLQSVDVLWNLAISELRSSRPLEALGHLREYQNDPRAQPADREKAKAYIEEAYARTGHLKVEGPPGAEVLVDAKPKGSCPITAEIDVEADRDIDVQVKVEQKSRHAKVKCPAGQVVTVRVEGEGAATVRIGRRGDPPPKDDDKSGGWPGAKVAAVVGLGVVGVGGLTVSGVLIPIAKGKEDAARDASKSATERADARSSNDSLRTMSTVFFYGGAAFALGSVAAAILWPNKHSEKTETAQKTAVHPLIGPGVLGAEGTF